MRSLRKPARFNYDLRGFLNLLEKNNDLVTIQKAVSSKFEISAIVSKFERKQAVMFERVRGSRSRSHVIFWEPERDSQWRLEQVTKV